MLYHIYNIQPTDGNPIDNRKKKDRDGFIAFIDAPGGTGKTYALNTFLNYVRGQNDIGLASAFSGVAALLLTGGTYTYFRFFLFIFFLFYLIIFFNFLRNNSS